MTEDKHLESLISEIMETSRCVLDGRPDRQPTSLSNHLDDLDLKIGRLYSLSRNDLQEMSSYMKFLRGEEQTHMSF